MVILPIRPIPETIRRRLVSRLRGSDGDRKMASEILMPGGSSARRSAGRTGLLRMGLNLFSVLVTGTLAWLWIPPHRVGPDGPVRGWEAIVMIAVLGGWIVGEVLWGLKERGDRLASRRPGTT